MSSPISKEPRRIMKLTVKPDGLHAMVQLNIDGNECSLNFDVGRMEHVVGTAGAINSEPGVLSEGNELHVWISESLPVAVKEALGFDPEGNEDEQIFDVSTSKLLEHHEGVVMRSMT